MGSAGALFLTGATGLVGGELARRYAADGRRVYALVRAPSEGAARDRLAARLGGELPAGLVAVPGDVTRPRLGLDEPTWRRLAGEVSDVLHAATDIHFGRPLAEARAVNVAGTQRVIELAEAAPRLRRVGHVSTVHVAGQRVGLIRETELVHAAGWVNTYEQTKYEAEVWLRGRMADLPIAVYRLSSVVGDARTGEVRQFNFLHQMLRLVASGLVPALPGDPTGPIDLIASDWVTDALAALFDTRFTPGATFHVCAGAAQSYSLAEVLDVTADVLARLRPGRVPQRPALVSLAEFTALVDDLARRGQRRQAQALGALATFAPHLAFPKAFDTTLAAGALAAVGVTLPDIRAYYPRVVEYCLRSSSRELQVTG